MSFIQMNTSFSNVQEKQPVPKGRYDLTISKAEAGLSGKQKPQIVVQLEIEGHPEASLVRHYLSLPAGDDDAEKVGNKMLMIKRFLEAFSVPYEDTGFNVEDFFGARGNVELILTDPDDEGANGNVYNRLNLPRLEDDATVTTKSTAGKKA